MISSSLDATLWCFIYQLVKNMLIFLSSFLFKTILKNSFCKYIYISHAICLNLIQKSLNKNYCLDSSIKYNNPSNETSLHWTKIRSIVKFHKYFTKSKERGGEYQFLFFWKKKKKKKNLSSTNEKKKKEEENVTNGRNLDRGGKAAENFINFSFLFFRPLTRPIIVI